VKLLLDTHSFLWFIMGSPRLGEKAGSLIADPGNERFLSVGSLWEMAIKVSLGKLKLAKPFELGAVFLKPGVPACPCPCPCPIRLPVGSFRSA
jgi:PIN domain nuclease of toxin-antitoxin system